MRNRGSEDEVIGRAGDAFPSSGERGETGMPEVRAGQMKAPSGLVGWGLGRRGA